MTLAGQQLGHYRILRAIGQGGMGEVYLAEDTRIARQVAIKVVRSEPTPYPDEKAIQEAERLFQREMKAVSQLDHSHILSFYDFGEQSLSQGKITYMVMPYRPEGSLTDWMARRNTTALLSPQKVGHLLSQAASALQHAHEHGIVHQDVKPSNFLVRERAERPTAPDLFLVDFGVAKILSGTATASNSVRGTHTYMAPEQWSGSAVPATDQYALAVMAYQLLTGVLPFQGRPEQVMFQHLTIAPQPPSTVNKQLSPSLDAVILRALAKKPEERFPSIAAFAAAYQQALNYVDLRSTIAITRAEAFSGTTRSVKLPSNRVEKIVVPPNAQAGDVLRLPNLGIPYYDGGPRGPLVITISTAQTEDIPQLDDKMNKEPAKKDTGPVKPPAIAAPPPKVDVIPPPPPGDPYTPLPLPATPAPLAKPSSVRTILLVAVALLVIVGGIIGASVVSNNIATNNGYATATADAQAAIDATAQAQATATVVAANPDPYSPPGTLALLDTLSDSSTSVWSANTDTSFGGQCQFASGGYQVSQEPPSKNYICDEQSAYSNFTFEVQMTITQGDCGGLDIRNNSSNSNLYFFQICQSGTYALYKYTSNSNSTSLASGSSQSITTGMGQANTIAIVANGGNFTLYVNRQQIDTASDSDYTQGTIGLIASTNSNATTVVYQNARVWTF